MEHLELGPRTPKERYTGGGDFPDIPLADRITLLGQRLVSARPVLPAWALPLPDDLDRKHGPFLSRTDKDLIATRQQVWQEIPASISYKEEELPARVSGAFLGVPGTDQYCVGIAESISGQLMATSFTPTAFPEPDRTRKDATRYRFREGVKVTIHGVTGPYLNAIVEGIPSRHEPKTHRVHFLLERLRPDDEPRGVFRIESTTYEGWTTYRRSSYSAQRNDVLAPHTMETSPQKLMNQRYLAAGEAAAVLLVDGLMRRNQHLWIDGKLQRPGKYLINHPVFRWTPQWALLARDLSQRLAVLDGEGKPVPTSKDHVEIALCYVAATGALPVPEKEYFGPLSMRLLDRV